MDVHVCDTEAGLGLGPASPHLDQRTWGTVFEQHLGGELAKDIRCSHYPLGWGGGGGCLVILAS